MEKNNQIYFALCEDGTLDIFESIHEIRKQCEGIDVESGVWDFFDHTGKPLTPLFHTPNRIKKHLFGLLTSITSSHHFHLGPHEDGGQPQLLNILTKKTIPKPQKFLKDIIEVTVYAKKHQTE